MGLINATIAVLYFGAIAALLFVMLWFVRFLQEEQPEHEEEFQTAERLLWGVSVATLVIMGVQAFAAIKPGTARTVMAVLRSLACLGVAGGMIWLGVVLIRMEVSQDELFNNVVKMLTIQAFVVAALMGVAGILVLTSMWGEPDPTVEMQKL